MDLIDRQAAIEAVLHHGEIENNYTDLYYDGYCDGVYDSADMLKDLPSAQPEPKTGRWLDTYNDGDWHCSECGAIVEKDEQIRHYWQRCYHCGAKMEVITNDNTKLS